ncbi:MAG: ABC-2 type transport system ATP-binding protein [Planctomycetota bacterium]|jgi:ABC-2 type transport system ATP-binding protein
MNAVELTAVTKTYGSHVAVNDLNLTIPKGKIYGFIGPNGSGKTTTLRMILSIIDPDSGNIRVLGHEGMRAANDSVGYLPEERGLYKKMTVQNLLSYYAELKGLKPKVSAPRIDEWLGRMELVDWKKKKIEQLSKGMAQKVQFLATILHRPELVILDEPFSGLDPVNLDVLRAQILRLRDEGATVIFSTHDMAMAERMCDSIMMIYKGEKVLDGTLDEIKQRYGEDTVRLRIQGGQEHLTGLPGVKHIVDMGQYQELRFDGDPQVLLQELASRTRVDLFEISQPSLHDIFVRIARPHSDDEADAAAQSTSAAKEALRV